MPAPQAADLPAKSLALATFPEKELGQSCICRRQKRSGRVAGQLRQSGVLSGRTGLLGTGDKAQREDKGGTIDKINNTTKRNFGVRNGKSGGNEETKGI